jgi:ribosome biogenesis GTPase
MTPMPHASSGPARRSLLPLGWDDRWEAEGAAAADAAQDAEGCTIARVVMESKRYLRVATAPGAEMWAEPAGRLLHEARDKAHLPAVGDWVTLRAAPGEERATIESILPRRSALTRLAAGGRGEIQVLAANVDVAFIVTSLNRELNPRRLERYVTLVRHGGAQPVLLLSKADLAASSAAAEETTARLGADLPAHAVSALSGAGLAAVRAYLRPSRTAILLGSSGVGKSTLANALLGAAVQTVQAVRREDDKGRHTTTARQLLLVPGGGVLIDTPGMRELRVDLAGAALGAAFADVEALAARCRFADCRHGSEPGCAVLDAVRDGSLPAARHDHYRRLREETAAAKGKDKPRQKRYNKHGRSGRRR